MSGFVPLPGLEHLLQQYLREMALDWDVLKSLLTGPQTDLARHAHGMGGKCAMMGDLALAKVLYALEQEALAGRRDQVASLLAEADYLLACRCPAKIN